MIGCRIQTWTRPSLVTSLGGDELMRASGPNVDELLRGIENQTVDWTRVAFVLTEGQCPVLNFRPAMDVSHPRDRRRHGRKSTEGEK